MATQWVIGIGGHLWIITIFRWPIPVEDKLIKAELILASKSEITGIPLYTFLLTSPRIILAEINTHRTLSRNAASSRAIAIKKQRENVIDNPFVPLSIGANQRGMQAGEELSGWRRTAAIAVWKYSRYAMVLANLLLEKLGAHKQVANRLVEPWMWVQQVVTATDWNNMLALRNHEAAEPHFHELARLIQTQIRHSEEIFSCFETPGFNTKVIINGGAPHQLLGKDEWHLPFDDRENTALTLHERKQMSAARCARVSYYIPESGARSDVKSDIVLAKRLSSSGHWSPFEHQATPTESTDYVGNFKGWKQFRKEFPTENGGDRLVP
jgi:hypothetical protein